MIKTSPSSRRRWAWSGGVGGGTAQAGCMPRHPAPTFMFADLVGYTGERPDVLPVRDAVMGQFESPYATAAVSS